MTPKLTDAQWLDELRAKCPDIDLDAELRKMDRWLLANPQRQKTRRFIVNWINKVDRVIKVTPTQPPENGGTKWL